MSEESKDRRDELEAAQTGSVPQPEATGHQPTEQLPSAPSPEQQTSEQQGPYGHTAPTEAVTAQHAAYSPYDQAVHQTTPMPPYQQHPYGAPGQPGYGAPGQQPGGPMPGYAEQPPRRRGAAGLIAGAIVLALISGGIGGAVGALVSHRDNNSPPVSNALNAPPPKAAPASNAPAGTVPAVAQKVLPSVVMIKVAGARAEGEGSGVILSSDGLILTNNHVASGAGPHAKMEVQFSDGSIAPASVVGTDPVSDLAVIKAANKTGLTPIELGTSANLQVGQTVVAIGSPLGLAGTVTTGIVSALNRPVSTSGEPGQSQTPVISAIQTDAPINPGNSGGPLVDMDGKLVGINTAIATLGGSPEMTGQQSGSIGLGFAIPVDQARRVADQLTKTGHATYAQIGITVNMLDPTTGGRVRDVTPDGPAAKAGIPAGAIVTKVNDQIIDSGMGLIAAVRSHQPGDKVKITYTDPDGQNPKTVEVTLDAAPAEAPR
ncbi:S1C family serine protease [Nocardia transvalensis]|uniref:S1C family serine protease n=1 Tax=Nocardia transvalensis TaxID=37333 RepID=UPI0018960FF6|nr:trypsin-like peptidase domain-containing protein [Nocardia transvalensis]MBF6330586.1 trypsin-like peptidase domain-containing protein [Nocardia transvalensis]